MNISFQKLFFAIATVFLIFVILILAKSILIPLSFALLISFILYPLVKKFESWGINKILSAFFSIFTVVLIIGGTIFLFSTQIMDITKEFSNFQDKIISTIGDVTEYINKNVGFIPDLGKHEIIDRTKEWLEKSSGSLVKQTFNSTTSFITGLFLTIVFTFLILIYREGLIRAFSAFAAEPKRKKVVKMYKSIQQVGKKYLSGMMILIVVIGFANSIGLLIIGIDNPFFFGFLGSFLAIIPYVGTVLGAIIPVLYAIVAFNSLGMAISIAVLFWFVQLLSDNLLSPKIVGSSININALTAILSLIVGAVVWGVAGMILFLPFAAMLKIVCEEYEELKPIALLIGNKNYQDDDDGNEWFNKWKNKIKHWFGKKGTDTPQNSTNKEV
ncbi:MAG TPA: AI-2E family transporter [Edaphocola sp.]|nr:AI-2E family transporter [Edaphocola sp.]